MHSSAPRFRSTATRCRRTRVALRGIALAGASQLVFIDTPGIFKPRRRLDRAMVEAAWGGAGDADMILLLVMPPSVSTKTWSAFCPGWPTSTCRLSSRSTRSIGWRRKSFSRWRKTSTRR